MKDIWTPKGDQLISYGTTFHVCKPGQKKSLYSMNCFVFNPKKHFIGSDVAKDAVRKIKHYSKQKIKDEYTAIYAVCLKVGRGKNTHLEFNTSAKIAANSVFIVPKKWLRDARRAVIETEIWDKDSIKNISSFL